MADQAVKQWFDFIDTDSSGRVSAPELQRALSKGGLHFSLQTVARMIGMYDTSGSGSVNFEEFNELHQFIVQTQNDFRMIDQNRDGLLSKSEVSDALAKAGFNISQPAFEALFLAYDPDKNQHLSMTEFLGLTLFLSMPLPMTLAPEPPGPAIPAFISDAQVREHRLSLQRQWPPCQAQQWTGVGAGSFPFQRAQPPRPVQKQASALP